MSYDARAYERAVSRDQVSRTLAELRGTLMREQREDLKLAARLRVAYIAALVRQRDIGWMSAEPGFGLVNHVEWEQRLLVDGLSRRQGHLEIIEELLSDEALGGSEMVELMSGGSPGTTPAAPSSAGRLEQLRREEREGLMRFAKALGEDFDPDRGWEELRAFRAARRQAAAFECVRSRAFRSRDG